MAEKGCGGRGDTPATTSGQINRVPLNRWKRVSTRRQGSTRPFPLFEDTFAYLAVDTQIAFFICRRRSDTASSWTSPTNASTEQQARHPHPQAPPLCSERASTAPPPRTIPTRTPRTPYLTEDTHTQATRHHTSDSRSGTSGNVTVPPMTPADGAGHRIRALPAGRSGLERRPRVRLIAIRTETTSSRGLTPSSP